MTPLVSITMVVEVERYVADNQQDILCPLCVKSAEARDGLLILKVSLL